VERDQRPSSQALSDSTVFDYSPPDGVRRIQYRKEPGVTIQHRLEGREVIGLDRVVAIAD
jgi:hypothetical protein